MPITDNELKQHINDLLRKVRELTERVEKLEKKQQTPLTS